MINYLLRRLFLLPITLFFILFINFLIINQAPGDPVTLTQISPEGTASRDADGTIAFGSDERYLQFREHYGLTLPTLFNTRPWMTAKDVRLRLSQLLTKKYKESDTREMPAKEYNKVKTSFGDTARFIMPKLLAIIQDKGEKLPLRALASKFFARGGSRQTYLGANITSLQAQMNKKISTDNNALRRLILKESDRAETVNEKSAGLNSWYQENKTLYQFEPSSLQKFKIFFLENRFFRYMKKVLTLDFGTLRNDDNKTVLYEVVKRFKYSLTLAIIPMGISFVLCQLFGCCMAYYQHKGIDYALSLSFLFLYALPVFVVVPFLIQMVAMNHHFPFTSSAIPISGFTSSDAVYNGLNSYQRLFDTLRHLFLPLIAVIYGTLASGARLSRTAVLEVLKQDYIRTARAKGLHPLMILFKHVGRNASITIVTSIASSLGIVLGGSLIVETLFEINGFGKFFYDAVINRDYNVIMFSSLAGALLSLTGFLAADIAYTVLDPRVSLE